MGHLPAAALIVATAVLAAVARPVSAAWSDAEIRRFALGRAGTEQRILPREYFLALRPGGCPVTVPDPAAARAVAEERKRAYGREHGEEIGPVEDDPRAYRVPSLRPGLTPAYRILRSDFYRCDADPPRIAEGPAVVGH